MSVLQVTFALVLLKMSDNENVWISFTDFRWGKGEDVGKKMIKLTLKKKKKKG